MADEQKPKASPLDVPDADWLQQDDLYRARVSLTGDDHAIVLALEPAIVERLRGILDLVQRALPEGGQFNADSVFQVLSMLKSLLSEESLDNVWGLIDETLSRAVASWSLADMAAIYSRPEPPRPADIEDKDERLAMLKSLPMPLLARLLFGVIWLSKNF